MEIVFATRKLQKACSSEGDGVRAWGAENSKKVRLRLADLQAAETLADVNTLPPARCHPLKGNRAGQFAVDVKHPFRIIFEPANDPVPHTDEGSLDLARVTRIRILAVEDYHGR